MNTPHTVYADKNGEIMIEPGLGALGSSGGEWWELVDEDLIPFPPGADLMLLPGRRPVGVNPSGEAEVIVERGVTAVAAVLPQGYTRLLLPAYERKASAPQLPLFGYTAVAAKNGCLYVTARRTDSAEIWNPLFYNTPELKDLVRAKVEKYPRNRILRQLEKCALEYHCLTAQNIFYGRWEGGIPVSPVCNARCLGCVSKQPAECCPSPQGRINFTPSVDEVVEVAACHLEGEGAIISFGQGCEGEPLLAGETIVEAVKRVRKRTRRGTININTNAGVPGTLQALAAAGLDSARISLFSANPIHYNLYHRPEGYDLTQVGQAIDLLREEGCFVSLNLLILPGFTDQTGEMEHLWNFLRRHPVNMIQFRNLNIDPDWFWEKSGIPHGKAGGIRAFITRLQKDFPSVLLGNFSRALR